MKSDSGSRPRLKRTLKRKVEIRDFTEEDIKFLWVAYKKGTLEAQEGLSAQEFHESVVETMLANFDYAWVIECQGKVVGVLTGINSGLFVLVGTMIWMPWASPRNKIEGIVKYLVVIRKKVMVLFHAKPVDKDFYIHIAKHGIIRRIGTLHDMGPEPLALFQVKKDVGNR